MNILISFLPILSFIIIYLFSGFYHFYLGTPKAFYQLSPNVAIIPALIFAWILNKNSTKDKIQNLIDGVRHNDIITMCIIFLLSGAFGFVTKKIGCVDATVNLALSLFPSSFLTIGLFITAAFIATSIGSSMGTIATLAPISLGMANQGAFSIELGMGTLIGGAMFGDNLSLISDTTIAAVNSQSADPRKKLKINIIVSFVASAITLIILFFIKTEGVSIEAKSYSFTLILPYIFLITLAVSGVNVFVVLVLSLIFAGSIGIIFNNYSIISFSKDISLGFESMYDIMALSMLIGGLSGLTNQNSSELAQTLFKLLPKKSGKKMATLLIAKIVSVFDILLANNTVAILLSGKIVKNISNKYKISPHESAAWLDIFSCVFQGLIPYGAQVLLAGSIASISPLQIIGHVYYCYILGVVSIIFILFGKRFF